jgi:hypothetical protein
MTRDDRPDALIVAAGATVLAGAAPVLSPQPSHADDPTTSPGFPTGQCTDTDLASWLAWQSAVILTLLMTDHPSMSNSGSPDSYSPATGTPIRPRLRSR